MKQPCKKFLSVLLTAALLNLCWLTSYGWAEMVGTSKAPPQITREMLINALQHEEVQKQLKQHGISKMEAAARINSLTDKEIYELAVQVNRLPAGGQGDIAGAIMGVIYLLIGVFIVIGKILTGLLELTGNAVGSGLRPGSRGNDYYSTSQYYGYQEPGLPVEHETCELGLESCTSESSEYGGSGENYNNNTFESYGTKDETCALELDSCT